MTNIQETWQIESRANGGIAGPINNPQAVVSYLNGQGSRREGDCNRQSQAFLRTQQNPFIGFSYQQDAENKTEPDVQSGEGGRECDDQKGKLPNNANHFLSFLARLTS